MILFNFIPRVYAISESELQRLSIPVFGGDLFTIISRVVNLVLAVAGIIALFYLIMSGISYITAGGDAEKATTARTGILNAAIGVAVIIAALAIFNFVIIRINGGGFFGGGGTTNTGGGGGGTGGGGGGTTLTAPTTSPAQGITSRGATVSWSAVTGATAYQVQWGQGGNFDFGSGQATSTSFAIAGLNSNTPYNWRVQARNDSVSSGWGNGSFITLQTAE